mgnify:CR=1 FL=1
MSSSENRPEPRWHWFLPTSGDGRNVTNVIPAAELANWKVIGNKLAADWVTEMNGKGLHGAKLVEDAKALIAKHSSGK